jgi:hypothetical protein
MERTKIYIPNGYPSKPGDYIVRFKNGKGCILLWGGLSEGKPVGLWKNDIEYYFEPKVN